MRYARVLYLQFKPGTIDTAIRKAKDTLAPIYRRQPGFVSYYVVKTGENRGLSFGCWESKAAAEAADRIGLEWMKQNIADLVMSSESFISELAIEAYASAKPTQAEIHP